MFGNSKDPLVMWVRKADEVHCSDSVGVLTLECFLNAIRLNALLATKALRWAQRGQHICQTVRRTSSRMGGNGCALIQVYA